ncbi:unnamed protein product, partial [marine sediment metagenome]
MTTPEFVRKLTVAGTDNQPVELDLLSSLRVGIYPP